MVFRKKKIGKSSKISPIIVLIFWGRIPCMLCLYIMLLNVVDHYDLSVLSMSMISFQKSLDRGVGGWVSSIQFFNFKAP